MGRSRCVLLVLFVAAALAAPRAVLIDGVGPWRDDNWKVGAREFRKLLVEAGYEVSVVAPAQLAPDPAKDSLVAAPSLERLPLEACKAISTYVALGGDLLASGGEPFREPLYRSQGRWVSQNELLAGVRPARIVLKPGGARLRRSSNRMAEPISQNPVAGPHGQPGSLAVKIPNLAGWDTLSTDVLKKDPFSGGETLTVVWVRGTPGQTISLEWREADKSRWVARVPLAAEWRKHVLTPSQFHFWPGGGDTKRQRTHFQPQQARALTFGPATSFGSIPGPVEYEIGPIAIAAAPAGLEEFEVPILETISPWYKQYDAVRDGHRVRIPFARARGLTAAEEPEGRYRVAGPLLNPAATRYFRLQAASLIWVPWPELAGAERAETIHLLRAASRKVAFLNGGARDFVAFPGEPIVLDARVSNASQGPAAVDVSWTIPGIGTKHVWINLWKGEIRDLTARKLPPLAAGEYKIETVLTMGGAEVDRIDGYLRVFDPRAARAPDQRIRAENGHFTLGGKPIFLNGVNYYPRYVSGQEPDRQTAYWLTPRNYDPEIIEADLSLMTKLGMNLVSINASKADRARPLMDFLERCRKHGIWANIYTGSANGLRQDPERDAAVITDAHLRGNDRVFAYDLAWEPKLGDHAARRAWDRAWRNWIAEQYGSIAEAEKVWGMAAPKDDAGRVLNPLDEQITTDGPHRIMVAAYRRFADDLISRVYGRVVRRLRTLDPDALMGARTGYGGTGQRQNNQVMGYDLAAGAAHLDFTSPEGYGMPPEFDAARSTGFITAYGRYAGNGKPVFWSEFGFTIGPRGGTPGARRIQALLCDSTLRMAADSGAAGAAVWWWPGGWRVNEQSDYGIVDPDGEPRESARILGEWGRKLNSSPPEPGSGTPEGIEIDRDADARGLLGLWARLGGRYVKAREQNRPVRLVTKGTGTDTTDMPLVQVGDVPYKGTGPLKYANAEIASLDVDCAGSRKTVENGGEIHVPGDTACQVTVSLVNTGEASWVACILRTNAGQAVLRGKVTRFGTAQAGPIQVEIHRVQVEIAGRLATREHAAFGETLRLRLRPE